MLHEILLALSGHPSPILKYDAENSRPVDILSRSEHALLQKLARLSDVHRKVIQASQIISTTHESGICQAVATEIRSTHLAQFQKKILEVEQSILRKDTDLVGAYDIVPLTSVVDAFSGWSRRMDWFLDLCDFIRSGCTGSQLIDRLCAALQTGYADIEEATMQLVKVAETAWLRQAAAWVLYGRLPSSKSKDFFIYEHTENGAVEYDLKTDRLPNFIGENTANSMLFIGKSLNQIREKGISTAQSSLGTMTEHLRILTTLSYPITQPSLSSVVASLRISLSQNALQKLLPMSRIQETLVLLHDYFLLGRGEFALALIIEADEKVRGHWRRMDGHGYENRDKFADVLIKEGEVKAVLARTWASMTSQQTMHEDDEEAVEAARHLIQLHIRKPSSASLRSHGNPSTVVPISTTPFNSLLLSLPSELTLQIPSPLDLFLTTADVQMYSDINAYLLAVRRAHIRLADLWKATSLRRVHPAPPGPPYGSSAVGRAMIKKQRRRVTTRSQMLRGVWATSSAALFLLGETEAYFHGEVIRGTWDGFQEWLVGGSKPTFSPPTSIISRGGNIGHREVKDGALKLAVEPKIHDPQALTLAHRACISALTKGLLLTFPGYTDSLYSLLQRIDYLVTLVHRIQSIWSSLDLEEDDGVVDAFTDFHKEEKDVEQQLAEVSEQVKRAIEVVIDNLRAVNHDKDGASSMTLDELGVEETKYVPRKVGRVDRLLMKLDFGGWFAIDKATDDVHDNDDSDEGDLGF